MLSIEPKELRDIESYIFKQHGYKMTISRRQYFFYFYIIRECAVKTDPRFYNANTKGITYKNFKKIISNPIKQKKAYELEDYREKGFKEYNFKFIK